MPVFEGTDGFVLYESDAIAYYGTTFRMMMIAIKKTVIPVLEQDAEICDTESKLKSY